MCLHIPHISYRYINILCECLLIQGILEKYLYEYFQEKISGAIQGRMDPLQTLSPSGHN